MKYSAYRNNKAYHDVANGKYYVTDTNEILLQNRLFFAFSKIFEKSKKQQFCMRNYFPQDGSRSIFLVSIAWHFPSATSWYTLFFLQALFSWRNLGNNIACFQSFSRITQNGPKKGHFLAFLRHPLWPNDIVVTPDGQAEKNGAIFAS